MNLSNLKPEGSTKNKKENWTWSRFWLGSTSTRGHKGS